MTVKERLAVVAGEVEVYLRERFGARMRERYGVEVQAMAADDGIVLRLPDIEFDDGADAGAELSELLFLDPEEIEPMVTAGGPDVEVLSDNWTAVTKDRSLSAHFEHTVAVTKNGPRILSLAE